MKRLFPVLACLVLAGCSTTGPGTACDPCAKAEVSSPAEATGPFAQAASASARGGQEATNQPTMTDPGARGVFTPISRGSGDQNATNSTSETRSQAGAPSVNQGLVLPTGALAANAAAPVNPAVEEQRLLLADLRFALKAAVATGDVPTQERLLGEIKAASERLLAAQAGSNFGSVTNNYNFNGSTNTMTVANGSASGDGQQAVDPANAKALADGLPATVRAAKGTPPAPPPPPEPPTSSVPPPAPAAPAEEGVTR